MIEPISNQLDCAEAVSDFQGRRFAQLTAQASRGHEATPEVAFHRALALAFSSRPDEALLIAAELGHAGADYPILAHSSAEIRAWAGQRGEAHAILSAPAHGGPHFARATLTMAAHDHGQALDALNQALVQRELGIIWIRTDARFDAVREERRFRDLVAQLDALGRD